MQRSLDVGAQACSDRCFLGFGCCLLFESGSGLQQQLCRFISIGADVILLQSS